MFVQITPSAEDCMECEHFQADGEAPSEKCIRCQNDPENSGEVVQFLMDNHTAYAVVLVDDEFWLVDIDNIRLKKGGQ